MLVQAMEISGVEGTFRITSENTMRVMRSNKESIMAVLEAFVHDPLINWRLVKGGRQLDEREGGATNRELAAFHWHSLGFMICF
jgi:FKBP12-rapamycin complex-associated protein